jgi:hypothetical protein
MVPSDRIFVWVVDNPIMVVEVKSLVYKQSLHTEKVVNLPDSVPVTVHILSHRIYLFSFLRRTHLLWGLYSYDWYHCMYLVGSTSFSLFLL